MRKLYRIQVWLMAMLFLTTATIAQNTATSVYRQKLDSYLQKGDRVSAAELMKMQNVPGYDFHQVTVPLKGKGTAYAFVAYDPNGTIPQGPAILSTDSPGTITSLAAMTSDDFIAGGTWAEGIWYGVEYGTGNLYTLDNVTGEMTLIGNGGAKTDLTGIAYVNGTMYASSISSLYTIELCSGALTEIGAFNITDGVMIALASDGTTLYGFDLGTDKLYTIDITTGAATEVGDLGIDINYAQDAEYDRDNNTLYLAGYTDKGSLYTVDVATGAATFVGDFTGGLEVTTLAIPYQSTQYDNDLAVFNITAPVSGPDLGNEQVTVNIKNNGTVAQSNFDVSYTLNGNTVTETFTETLDPGDIMGYTFATTADLSEYGTYDIEVCVDLSNDGNPDNDCCTRTVENLVPSLCLDGLYSTGCSFGDGLTYWDLEGVTVDIPCGEGDPYDWYHNFADDMNMLIVLNAGGEYTLKVKAGFTETYVDIWIDFNDDLYLSDDEHIVDNFFCAEEDTEYDITFTLPAKAGKGMHTLRYRTNWQSGVEESCEELSFGNMCDFMVDISSGSSPMFADDFDSYTSGEQLACQNPDDWTTWSDAPCDATEDPYISDAQSHTAPNSVNIVNDNDLVKKFGTAGGYPTTGKYKTSFYMYIPSGNDAYWNAMQDFDASTSTYVWGFEAYYDNGNGVVNANGINPAATFTYSYDTWMLTELVIDLDNDIAQFLIDGTLIYEWPWSVGTSNSNLNQLAAFDFYGYQQTNPCSYYMDDFTIEEEQSGVTLDPPVNVLATATGSDVTVTWDAPGSGTTGWIEWDDGINDNAIGLTGGGTFYAASHWLPSDLTDYNGMYLSKVSFYISEGTSPDVTVKVWEGENAATELVSQVVTITPGEWNEVTLDTPVEIDASQELWFGYEVTHVDGESPAGIDAGPAVEGKGDMISTDGVAWVTLTSFGLSYNWNIAGYVTDAVTSPIAKQLTKEVIENPSSANFAVVQNTGHQHASFLSVKGLTGYNIYRDGVMVGNTSETTFTDAGLPAGTYTYCVTAVYDEGESVEACADPVDVIGQEPGIIYEDDFETYTVGEQMACQNPDDWTTWDLSPCSATDAYVSDTYAYSGTNSVNIVDENDLVYPIADYTEGYYKLSFYMYIPSGNDGYWNVLQSFNDGNYAWGLEVLYNSTAEGQAVVDAGGAGAATFDFAYDTWMYNEVYINLYTDNAEFYVDGNLVVSWQWSTGAAGDGNLNQLGGVDLYGWTGGLNAVCNYYFDDFMLEELSFELPDPPTNVMATLTDNDVTVTWEAPGSGNGSNEFADDFESGTFDAWGEVIEGSATAGGDQEPYWTIYDVDPYEGAYDASCGWGYNVDTWLITPPIEITSNTKVTFAWNSSYYWEVDPNDNGDLFVKVSTDGGTTWDALWTFGDIGEWDSWTWYETMVDLSAYAGQTVLVAFNNVGDDNAQVNLDNVFIGESTKDAGTRIVSSIPDLDSKLKSLPKDYIYDYKGVKDLLGYNVYRNDMLIGYTTEMSYYDEDLTSGTYTYCVSAVYDDGESQAICADPVTVEQPYFPAPTNLTGPDQVSLGEPIDLTWDEPGTSGWMQWDDGVNVNGIGLTNGGTFYVASHWEPSDLVPYAGMYISKIVFYYNVTTSKADFVLKVWKGANASTELLSQVITPEAEWNEIILDTPVQIDGSQDLWFGYEVTTVSGEFPAGVDAGPAVVGKGDMISLDGSSWGSLYELTGGSLDGNWNLSAYVSLTAKGAVAVPLEKTTISNPAPAEFVSVATHPVTPSFTPSEKGFTHYNIYRDGTVIGTSTETSYTDTGYGNEGVYEYYVTAVYDEGESDPSNTHVVNVITGLEENTVSGLKLYPNPARDYLNIRADAVINTVQVLNFAGQLILNESVNSSSYRINVSNLRAGVYMIRIETEEGTTTQRIVVQ
jgi:hypothetical protein